MNRLYPHAKELILSAGLSWGQTRLTGLTADYLYDDAHLTIADIDSGAIVDGLNAIHLDVDSIPAATVPVESPTDVTIGFAPGPLVAFVVHVDVDADGGTLIAYIDRTSVGWPFSVDPDGTVLRIVWPDAGPDVGVLFTL